MAIARLSGAPFRGIAGEAYADRELDPDTSNPCFIFMPETHMGGTMRLGSNRTYFQGYGYKSFIDERHRYRFEVNPEMVGHLEDSGLSFTGKNEIDRRMEIVELPHHPYYISVQFHPEFKSRPGKPSALFLGLVAAASGQLEPRIKAQQMQIPASKEGGSSIYNKVNIYQNGNAHKFAKMSSESVYDQSSGICL